jgi:hypothetical protein
MDRGRQLDGRECDQDNVNLEQLVGSTLAESLQSWPNGKQKSQQVNDDDGLITRRNPLSSSASRQPILSTRHARVAIVTARR